MIILAVCQDDLKNFFFFCWRRIFFLNYLQHFLIVYRKKKELFLFFVLEFKIKKDFL